MAALLVAGGAVAVTFVLLVWIIVLQQRLIGKQSETIEKLRRACERERAGKMVLESELRFTVDSAKVVSLWSARSGGRR